MTETISFMTSEQRDAEYSRLCHRMETAFTPSELTEIAYRFLSLDIGQSEEMYRQCLDMAKKKREKIDAFFFLFRFFLLGFAFLGLCFYLCFTSLIADGVTIILNLLCLAGILLFGYGMIFMRGKAAAAGMIFMTVFTVGLGFLLHSGALVLIVLGIPFLIMALCSFLLLGFMVWYNKATGSCFLKKQTGNRF